MNSAANRKNKVEIKIEREQSSVPKLSHYKLIIISGSNAIRKTNSTIVLRGKTTQPRSFLLVSEWPHISLSSAALAAAAVMEAQVSQVHYLGVARGSVGHLP